MDKAYYYVKKILLFAVRLFFVFLNNGTACKICGKTTWIYPVCKKCREKFFSIEQAFSSERCSVCGKVHVSTKGLCMECRTERVIFHADYVLPLFSYRLWNRQLMFCWKKTEDRSLSFFFGRLMSQSLKKLGIDTVVPVPPRPGKIGEKGWDQIDDICRFLHYECGFKLFPVLERISGTEQKKKDRKNRLESISGAYRLCSEKKLKAIQKKLTMPETVCIIDDVCTTGATLESCAILLKNLNIRRVFALTLFCVD